MVGNAGEVERLLDALDAAMLDDDRAGVAAATEQLWAYRRQVPAILAERLIGGRARIPGLAFELLGGSAGPTAGERALRRVAAAAAAPDMIRWGARRRVGWPQRGEAKARLEFLLSLQDADATLIEAVVQAGWTWLPDVAVLEEVLAYLTILPAERRHAIVQRALGEPEPSPALPWLLRALLHMPDPELVRLAIGELVRVRDRAAAGALRRLAQTSHDAGLRAEAEAAERRLRLQIVAQPTATSEEEVPVPWLPLEAVHLSAVDGAGAQVLLLLRQWEAGTSLVADVLQTDTWGLKDAFGHYRALPGVLTGLTVESFQAGGVDLVEVDLPSARGVLAAALATNAATGRPVPPAFELWEPLFHDTFPPVADEPLTVPELDDAPFAARADLVRRSTALLEHPFFASWFFNPDEIGPLLDGIMLGRGGRLTEAQYGPVIRQLVDTPLRERLRQRLCRQAWILDRHGDRRARDLALATAASLAGVTAAGLTKHPFLRAMVDASLDNLLPPLAFGPVRVR
jgi:hypothetical protein